MEQHAAAGAEGWQIPDIIPFKDLSGGAGERFRSHPPLKYLRTIFCFILSCIVCISVIYLKLHVYPLIRSLCII